MFLDVQGIRTHYVTAGNGPPMVLVHGLGESTWTWREVMGPLSTRFSVIAVDLKGFGKSENPTEGDYSVKSMAEFVLEFMSTVCAEPAVLVCHSFGGKTGIHAVLREPARFRGLVLLATTVGRPPPAHPAMRTLRLMAVPGIGRAVVRGMNIQRISRRIVRDLHADTYTVTDEDVQAFCEPATTPERRRAFLAHNRDFLDDHEAFARLGELAVPTLLVWGRQDRFLPVKHGEVLTARIPGAKLHVLDDCGHSAHEDQPMLLTDLLVQTFARANSPAPVER